MRLLIERLLERFKQKRAEPLFRLLRMRVSRRKSRKNYAINCQNEIRGRIISCQSSAISSAGNFRIGKKDVDRCGCGAVAVYNALELLKLNPTFGGVIRDMEQSGCLMFKGALGSDPYTFDKVFRLYGAHGIMYEDTENLLADMREGDVAIFTLWNDFGAPRARQRALIKRERLAAKAGEAGAAERLGGAKARLKKLDITDSLGMHHFVAVKRGRLYTMINRYSNQPRQYLAEDLGSIIKDGHPVCAQLVRRSEIQ